MSLSNESIKQQSDAHTGSILVEDGGRPLTITGRVKGFVLLQGPLMPSDGWGRVYEGTGDGPVEGGNRGFSFRAPNSLFVKLDDNEDSVPDLLRA